MFRPGARRISELFLMRNSVAEANFVSWSVLIFFDKSMLLDIVRGGEDFLSKFLELLFHIRHTGGRQLLELHELFRAGYSHERPDGLSSGVVIRRSADLISLTITLMRLLIVQAELFYYRQGAFRTGYQQFLHAGAKVKSAPKWSSIPFSHIQ